jgi:hypothetical protein
MTATLSLEARKAFNMCLISRGKRVGHFLAKAPSYAKDPKANAAWHGAMLSINPYKVSIMMMMMASVEEKAIFEEVKTYCDAHPELRKLDRDRNVLETLGVW